VCSEQEVMTDVYLFNFIIYLFHLIHLLIFKFRRAVTQFKLRCCGGCGTYETAARIKNKMRFRQFKVGSWSGHFGLGLGSGLGLGLGLDLGLILDLGSGLTYSLSVLMSGFIKVCPICKRLGLHKEFWTFQCSFCSQDCYRNNWQEHNKLHEKLSV